MEWEEDGEEDEKARFKLGVVGKIWTTRNINVNAFMTTIKNVWQLKHGMDISNVGKNMYVFQFYHWKDKARILEGQP